MKYILNLFLILCCLPVMAQKNNNLNSINKLDSLYDLLSVEILKTKSTIKSLADKSISFENELRNSIAANNLSLSSKIDTISNQLHDDMYIIKSIAGISDSTKIHLTKELETYKAKEDYFVAALGEQATRFALIITGLLAFLGLISFTWYKNEKRLIRKEFRDFRKEFETLKKENENLEIMLREVGSNSFKLISKFLKQSEDIIGALAFIVTSAKEACHAISLKKGDDYSLVESNLKIALSYIKSLKKEGEIKRKLSESYNSIFKDIEFIQGTNNTNIKNMCAEIRVLINKYLDE